MDMISTGSVVASKVAGAMATRFGKSVVERWTRYRAERFFDAFLEALATEAREGVEALQVDRMLDEMFEDDGKSEALFDAYRRVCFSASKDLGPRIIAFLTARLVNEGRIADEGDEQVFRAAELLGDGELLSFFKEYGEHRRKASLDKKGKEYSYEGGNLVIAWNEEERDSRWSHSPEREIEVGPLDFGSALGLWAVKLEGCGLVSSRVTQSQQSYREDSERYIDQDGMRTIYRTSIVFLAPCRPLYDLILRSVGAGDKCKTAPADDASS